MDVDVGVPEGLPFLQPPSAFSAFSTLSPQAAHHNHAGALKKPDARLCTPKTNDISRVFFLNPEGDANVQKSPPGYPQTVCSLTHTRPCKFGLMPSIPCLGPWSS